MAHNHSHRSVEGSTTRNLSLTMALNFFITAMEIIGGFISGSLSLVSDALHNFSDGIALIITYVAMRMSEKPRTLKYTFGLKRVEILAAIINASSLIIISFFLIKEAIERFFNPSLISGSLMLIVASIGLLANISGTLLLKKGSKDNLNLRAAYFHLLSDAVSSLAVIIGAIFIIIFQIYWIDPLLTILISLYILKEAYKITKEAIEILIMSAPREIDVNKIKKEIETLEGIVNIHHIHIWKLNDNQIHFETHVEVNDSLVSELMPLKEEIENILKQSFNVSHTTIQFEISKCKNLIV